MLLLLYFIVFVSNNKFTREPPQKWPGFEWKILEVLQGGARIQDGELECQNFNENVNDRFEKSYNDVTMLQCYNVTMLQ